MALAARKKLSRSLQNVQCFCKQKAYVAHTTIFQVESVIEGKDRKKRGHKLRLYAYFFEPIRNMSERKYALCQNFS